MYNKKCKNTPFLSCQRCAIVPEEDGVVLLNPEEIAFETGTIGNRSIDCLYLIPPPL